MSHSKSVIATALGQIIAFLFITWLCWLAYTWIMPQVFPQGPDNLINPGFWLFFMVIWLAKFIINILTPEK